MGLFSTALTNLFTPANFQSTAALAASSWATALATQDAWTALSGLYVNSWVDLGGGNMAGAYTKDSSGIVHLRGVVKSGSTGVICTLPAGYRPSATCTFTITSNNVYGNLYITTAGVVTAQVYNNASLFLEGIQFSTA